MATALALRSSIRVPVSEALQPPSLVASIPAPWIWVLAIACGGAAGALTGRWLERRHAGGVLVPLFIPGLAALAYVPGVLYVLPSLAAFSGRFLDLVMVGCGLAALWRLFSRHGHRIQIRAGGLAVLFFVTFLALGYRFQEVVGISGDEPHYLLITYSLIHDKDLAVQNNYASQDYRNYFNGKMGAHLAHGTPYSVHGIGLPLLLVPGFALWGLRGVLLTEALLGALVVREIVLTVEGLDVARPAAVLGAGGFAATAPGLFLCVSTYPELPAALIVIASVRRVVVSPPAGRWKAWLWGLSFGLLAFFHIKYIPLALVLGIGMMWFWKNNRWWVFGGLAMGLVALVIFLGLVMGNPNPLATYGTQRVFVERIPLGLAGLLFDQEFGLLPHSPFYLVCLAATGALLARKKALGVWTFGVLAAVALPGAAHPLWSGGTSPPARFLFPALPLLAVAGAALSNWGGRRGVTPWLGTLLIASLCLGAFMALGPEQPLYLNQRDGSASVWMALGESWDLTHYFPSLVRADVRSIALSAVGALVLVTAFVAQFRGWRFTVPPVTIMVLTGACLLDGLAPGSAAEAERVRWMSRLLRQLPGREEERFVRLPSARLLSQSDVVGLVRIPLQPATVIHLPAGEYELRRDRETAIRLCNGEGCFEGGRSDGRFAARVAMARFHVQSERPLPGLELTASSVTSSGGVALRTLGFPWSVRIHGLDDNAYLDPRGFWVRAGAVSNFALEGGCRPTCALWLVNGSRDNWIELRHRARRLRFRLGARQGRRLEIPMEEGVSYFSVWSASGFRPSELDPPSPDGRRLGVFLTSTE